MISTRASDQQIKDHYDVVIIGGGIVGLTLACALSSSALRIALVDEQQSMMRSHTRDTQPVLATRVSAITPGSQRIFANLGVWPLIQKQRMGIFSKMEVWEPGSGSGSASAITFAVKNTVDGAMGYIIENEIIVAALSEHLQNCCNIDWLCPAKLQHLVLEKNQASVQLLQSKQSGHHDKDSKDNKDNKDDRVLTAKLIIGADGGVSPVRRLANIDVCSWDYAHSAIVATVRCEKPHQAVARQRFLSEGILAFLPLSELNLCSIVWSVSPERAQQLMDLTAEDFAYALATAFDHQLGAVTVCSERAVFPLRMRHAKQYVLPHLALVGDAAHTIHPLAGQGVNLGLLDAACLAEVILDAQQRGRDFASYATLRRYERWRKGENLLMISVIEALKRLFACETLPIPLLRSLGLSLTNKTPLLKNTLLRRAMGVSGDLPKLAY